MLKSKIKYMLIIALLFAWGIETFGQTVVPATKQEVDKLVAVIKSNAELKEKMDACRLLSIVGTKDAIAPLAALLGDEQLSHMARYGLEPIPDPGVDEALRDALGKVKGRPLAGVIGSIGVRRDAKAVQPLMGILMNSEVNPEAKCAALRALGKIGTMEAAEVLKESINQAPPEGLPDVYEGLFRCAERFAGEGNRNAAIDIYDLLREQDAPHQVRAGALRGAILVSSNGLRLLQQHLRSDDYILFSAAVQTAQELTGTGVTKALTDALDQLPADNQILVIQALGKRGDAEALPALFTLAKNGAKSVRISAIQCMSEIGDAGAVPVLVEILNDGDSEIAQAAQESLASVPGHQADQAVTEMINSRQVSQRLTALELVSRRRMTSSIPALLKAAADNDQKIRSSALRKVGELGSLTELPALLDLLIQFKSSQDVEAVKRALSAICTKSDNPETYTTRLTGLLGRVQPMQKVALLHVLGVIGGADSLDAVRAEVTNPNEVVREAAISALCSWKTADAAPHLLALAKDSPFSSRKTATLRGYINLIRDENLSTVKKLEMCREATGLIQRNEEKKLLLGVLGTVPSVEALSMAMSYMADPLVRNEACFAVVAISEKIVLQNPEAVAEAIGKVLKATNNRNVTRRARQVLDKVK
ncbi:MAG: HEAT repeat domain-containing protein [Sedimentisphaerales bacterium]|nr:HEAT repeat domain-containing protein [Sedimentisphaerales bacterium]